MANWKGWRSENVNAIKLNCKVVKKWQPPISTSTLPFQVYPSPFLAENFVPAHVTQYLEGPTPSNYDISVYVKAYAIFSQTNKITK